MKHIMRDWRNDDDDDEPEVIEVPIVKRLHETDDAMRFLLPSGRKVWVPSSLVHYVGPNSVRVAAWFARKEGYFE